MPELDYESPSSGSLPELQDHLRPRLLETSSISNPEIACEPGGARPARYTAWRARSPSRLSRS